MSDSGDRNARHSFPDTELMYPNVLFGPSNGPKTEHGTFIEDKRSEENVHLEEAATSNLIARIVG